MTWDKGLCLGKLWSYDMHPEPLNHEDKSDYHNLASEHENVPLKIYIKTSADTQVITRVFFHCKGQFIVCKSVCPRLSV